MGRTSQRERQLPEPPDVETISTCSDQTTSSYYSDSFQRPDEPHNDNIRGTQHNDGDPQFDDENDVSQSQGHASSSELPNLSTPHLKSVSMQS